MRSRAPRRIVLASAGVGVTLAVVSVTLVHEPLGRVGGHLGAYLDVLRDANLPTWWSTGLLTVTALAHAVTGLVARAPLARWWLLGAALLAVLSLTEHTGLHDRLDGLGQQLFGLRPWTADWVVLGSVAAVAVALAFAVIAQRVGGGTARLLVAGIVILLGSELAGEILGGIYVDRAGLGWGWLLSRHGGEVGENVGAALLLAAAADRLLVVRDGAVLRVRYRPDPPPQRRPAPVEPSPRPEARRPAEAALQSADTPS